MKRFRFSGFLYPYLLCALVLASITLSESLKKVAEDGEEDGRLVLLLAALGQAALMALLSIPIRILVGLFPESSGTSWVRFLRRIVVGVACGPVPVLAIALLGREKVDNVGELVGLAMMFGALVGLGDSLSLDHSQDRGEHPE